MSAARGLPPPDAAKLELSVQPRLLVVRFAEPQRAASWAIVGGGLVRTQAIAWLQVTDADLRPPRDARDVARSRLASAGVRDAVALLTSRDLRAYVDTTATYQDVTCRSIATVGLGNALRAGDAPGAAGHIGTINVMCRVSVPLADEALLEALALAAEARTLAVREADVPSTISGAPASGTGTDCIVVAAPEGPEQRYAGKHTVIGHVVGDAVHRAVRDGAERWKRERARAEAPR